MCLCYGDGTISLRTSGNGIGPKSRASSWNVCGLNPRLSADKEAPA